MAVLKWITFDPAHQTWPEFKEYFNEACENRIALGAGTAATNNYYGATNAFENNDDGSIKSTKESFSAT